MTLPGPRPAPPRPPSRTGARTAPRPMYQPRPVRTGMLGRGRGVDAIVIAALLAVAAIIAALAFTRGAGSVDMDTTHAELTTPPPAEWSADGLWRSPALLPRSGRVLVVDPDHVAMVTKDRKVLFVEAATGKTTWAGTLPDGDLATPLATTTVGDVPAVAAQFGDTLAWWATKDGAAGTIALPAQATVSFRGTAPLARGKDGSIGAVTRDGVRPVTVPAGAVPLAARPDGTVTAASPKGWWHLTPGAAPRPVTPWEAPGTRGDATIVGYVGSNIVTAVAKPVPTVVVHADRAADVRYLFHGRYAPSARADAQTWTASPSRTWGIYGRTLVDTDAGTLTDLGGWKTALVDEDRALGTVGEQSVVAGPTIPRGVLQNREGFPEGIMSPGALVRSKEDGEEYVRLLPPAEGT